MEKVKSHKRSYSSHSNGILQKTKRQLFCQALGENDISEEFVESLDRFNCRKMPTTENVKNLILEVAHKEIVQKPQYVAVCWRHVLQTRFHDTKLSSMEGLRQIFKDIEPTI